MSDPHLLALARLRTYRRGETRAPHKPLLLLVAIGERLRGRATLSLDEVETRLTPLLLAFAPPVRGRPEPHLPFWHLGSDDGLWQVAGADALPRTRKGFPELAALRAARGSLADDFASRLDADPGFATRAIALLLERHFPATLHPAILSLAGLDALAIDAADEDRGDYLPGVRGRARDAAFRHEVLDAYGHRCAASGFAATLAGVPWGCEAAHVHWHAFDGPDRVDNGLCLEPTLHRLFDAGAWTLDDERRIVVSATFEGNDEAAGRLLARHGAPLAAPVSGRPVALDCIRWHREPTLGGVFRQPPRPPP